MMMRAVKKIIKWIKVIKIAVRTELMNIKMLKINKKDNITVDNEFNS